MEELIIPFLTFVFVIGRVITNSLAEKSKEETKKGSGSRSIAKPQSRKPSQPTFDRFEAIEVGEQQFEADHNKQVEQLRKELNVSTTATLENLADRNVKSKETDLDKLLVSAKQKRTLTKKEMGLNRYFTDKGLAGSIVMSEVLGQPRSKRPYQTNRR